MKPESAAFLRKAREFLAKADGMLDDWPDEAGRAAYLAGLHGAQALIVERTDKIIKRHRGVQRELSRLTRDEPGFDVGLRAFLGRTYNLKAIADYDTGEARVTSEQAREAIETATRLVETVAGMLPSNDPGPDAPRPGGRFSASGLSNTSVAHRARHARVRPQQPLRHSHPDAFAAVRPRAGGIAGAITRIGIIHNETVRQ